MIEYNSLLNELTRNLYSDYNRLCDFKSEAIIKECFEDKYQTVWNSQIAGLSNQFQELIDFLEAAVTIEKLNNTMEIINKYHTAYSIQELFKHLGEPFIVVESEKYIEAKREEKILKQKLKQQGISTKLINKYFKFTKSKREICIPPRNAKESYQQYLQRVFSLCNGDFDEMIKAYKKITSPKDWQLYTNVKALANAIRTNGIDKTINELYDYLGKK